MQFIIDVKDSALDKVMYILENLKDDVKIISQKMTDDFDIEVINEDDPDYAYVKEARKRREKGEKTYSIDEAIKEIE